MNRRAKRIRERQAQKKIWREDMKKKGYRGKTGAKFLKRTLLGMLRAEVRKKVIHAGAGMATEDSPILNPRKNAKRWARRKRLGRYNYN